MGLWIRKYDGGRFPTVSTVGYYRPPRRGLDKQEGEGAHGFPRVPLLSTLGYHMPPAGASEVEARAYAPFLPRIASRGGSPASVSMLVQATPKTVSIRAGVRVSRAAPCAKTRPSCRTTASSA